MAHDSIYGSDPARDRLAALRRPVARRLRAASWLTVVASLLWIAQAACVADLFAALVAGTPPAFGISGEALVFLLIGTLRAGLTWVADGLGFEAAQDAVSAERRSLVERESRRSPLAEPPGDSAPIAALASEKLAMTVPWLTRYEPAMLRTKVVPLVIFAVALWLSWTVALILLVAGPLIPLFMALIGIAAKTASERQLREVGTMNALLMERLRALPDLRLLDAVGRTIVDFEAAADNLRKQTMKVLGVAFLSSAVLELFAALGVAMVAVYVGFALLGQFEFGAWATPLAVFEGVFLLLLAPEFFQPLRDLAAAWHDRAAALAVADELAVLEAHPRVMIAGSGAPAEPLAGPPSVSARGLEWLTPAGRLIRLPDFDCPPGSKTVLVGPSGSGKSTLLALLAGLAEPAAGEIRVCGERLDGATADAWRARLAWIGQRPHFLNASLRANLALSGGARDDGRMRDALERASALHVVDGLPRGLDTWLGETGHGVSGGEARRLTIARALYRGAPVLFADEPTADLDDDTAAAVTEALLDAANAGAVLIVATHDQTLAASMDRIVDLEAAP